MRRAIAVLGIVVILALLAFVLRSCVNSQRENALRDYNQQVNELATASSSNVSQALETLTQSDQDAVQQRAALDDLASDSQTLTQRARDLSTPGGLDAATWDLATALGLRADALARIADRIGTARGSSRAQAEAATSQIAGQLSVIYASDILWTTRVTPFILDEFRNRDLNTEAIEGNRVIADLSWLNAAAVSDRIGGQSATADAAPDEEVTGLHGHSLESVTANGTALQAGGAPATVSAADGVDFVVTIANGGDTDETNVSVTVSGASKATGRQVFSETKRVDRSAQGASTPVRIPIPASAIEGNPSVTVTAEVKKVPGEDKLDNNSQEFSVIFN